MYEEMMGKVYDQANTFVGPAMKANKLAVNNFEKLVAFQMSNLQYFVDLSMGQLKQASAIDSPKALQDYFGKQVETATEVRQKMIDDVSALLELGNEFKDEFSKVATENVAAAGKAKSSTKKTV